MTSDDGGFLSRWSRRKAQAREGVAPEEPVAHGPSEAAPPAAPVAAAPAALLPPPVNEPAPAAAATKPAPPTLADVAQLTRESDYGRFVAPGVDGEVKNAALKKLFTDPHFNAMDGLDVYIDDYNKPDPLPKSMLRQMAQAAFLGLLDDEPPPGQTRTAATLGTPVPDAPAVPAGTPDTSAPDPVATPHGATAAPDEDADLRLQSHDAAGRGGAASSAAAGDAEPH